MAKLVVLSVTSCSILFWNAVSVLILNSICNCAGNCIIWSLVNYCSHKQQLLWVYHFHFCNIVAVGNWSLHTFMSRICRSILFNPLRHFYPIVCFFLSVQCYFVSRKCMHVCSMYAFLGDAVYYLLLSCHWFLFGQAKMGTYVRYDSAILL